VGTIRVTGGGEVTGHITITVGVNITTTNPINFLTQNFVNILLQLAFGETPPKPKLAKVSTHGDKQSSTDNGKKADEG
jgi:hypothetical protein